MLTMSTMTFPQAKKKLRDYEIDTSVLLLIIDFYNQHLEIVQFPIDQGSFGHLFSKYMSIIN